jgi:hypothetical protein
MISKPIHERIPNGDIPPNHLCLNASYQVNFRISQNDETAPKVS